MSSNRNETAKVRQSRWQSIDSSSSSVTANNIPVLPSPHSAPTALPNLMSVSVSLPSPSPAIVNPPTQSGFEAVNKFEAR